MSNKIQLYSLGTPNGQKVSIALEEMGIDYETHKINILKGDQFSDEFKKINPNSKIPAIVDPVGNDGSPLSIFESGAILIYLAEKSGKFYSTDIAQKTLINQWLFFQVGGPGPIFGQFGHFYKFAKDERDLSYGTERYTKETRRLLSVIDYHLHDNLFLAGDDVSIADFSLYPWVVCLDKFYEASETLELNKFKKLNEWVKKLSERPGVQKGEKVLSV